MWKELSRAEFEVLSKDDTVAVLPIGSIEQHGPHLPVGTDTLIVGAIVESVAQQLQDVACVFLPTVWCSKSNEHKEFAGTVLLTLDTLTRVLVDISASVARAGFRKLVFINGRRATLNTILKDGDRLGVFPPIGGG